MYFVRRLYSVAGFWHRADENFSGIQSESMHRARRHRDPQIQPEEFIYTVHGVRAFCRTPRGRLVDAAPPRASSAPSSLLCSRTPPRSRRLLPLHPRRTPKDRACAWKLETRRRSSFAAAGEGRPVLSSGTGGRRGLRQRQPPGGPSACGAFCGKRAGGWRSARTAPS